MTLTELIISVMIGALVLIIIFNFISNILNSTRFSAEKNKIVEQGFKSYTEFNKKIQGGFFGTGVIDYDEGVGYDVLLMVNQNYTKGYIGGVVDVNTMKLDPPSDYDIYKNKVFGYRVLSSSEISEILSDPNKVYDKVFFKDKLYDSLFAKDFQVETYNNGSILDISFIIGMGYNENFNGEKISNIVRQDYLMKFNLNF